MSYLKHKPGSIEELMANEASKLNDNAYQDMFKKELEKAGKGIGAMTPAEKKAFFNKIDDKYKAKNEDIKEAVDNPYAVGMAVAKKMKNDEPPLEKSTITKAHDIAKSIAKDDKKEEVTEAKYPHKMYSKDGKEVEAKTPEDHKKYADMGYTHKNKTHSFMTKDMNKSKKDAKGEKEIVDPEPKMKQESLLDAVKNVWQLSAEELEKIQNEANYMKAGRMNQYKSKEEQDKNKKGTADTGSKETKVDVEPKVDYKN